MVYSQPFIHGALTNEDLQRDDNTFVLITPEGEWDPNNKVYEENKNASRL